jgi:hypothetical protein
MSDDCFFCFFLYFLLKCICLHDLLLLMCCGRVPTDHYSLCVCSPRVALTPDGDVLLL